MRRAVVESVAECGRGSAVVISCEHAGNDVPDAYRSSFRVCPPDVLASHRGWDAGAVDVARALSERLRAPLFVAKYTRLLVDLNRSRGHPQLFSEYTRALPPSERERLLHKHYRPYRSAVENEIKALAAGAAFVLHVSVHSFTPVLDRVERHADAALLYDPSRAREAIFAKIWRATLQEVAPAGWIIRRNYPYRGTSDGLTTHLRGRFGPAVYAGVELEINQKYVSGAAWPAIVDMLAVAFEAAVCRDCAERGAR